MNPKDEINKRIAKLLTDDENLIEKMLTSHEKVLISSYRSALNDIKSQIAAMFEKYGDKVDYKTMVAYNRLTNLEQSIAEQLKALTNENIKTTESSLKDIYSIQYYNAGYAIETSAGVRLGFGQLDPNVIKASLLNPLSKIKWPESMKNNTQAYLKKINQSLTEGLLKGKGYSYIAKDITTKTEIETVKALRIARTEGHRVQTAARVTAYDKSQTSANNLGIGIRKIWVATLDNRTRDSHREMDGQEADENGLFHFPSGGTTEGPGLSGIAEEDINCRCTTVAEISGFKSNFRKDNISKETIKNIPYSEWAKMKGIPA